MAAMALLLTALPSAVIAQDTKALPDGALPGGATSLNETFEDWIVNCAVAEGTRRCLLSQQQHSQQTRQLVLAVELVPAADGALQTTLVLPFGLALDEGVTLQVDELPQMAPQRFRTCLPVGCIVTLSVDEATQASLRSGAAVKVAAKADGTGETLALAISLKGFGPALDRVQALLK